MGHDFTTRGGWFIDPAGRHTLLRGVNLAGSSKVPLVPDGATHLGTAVGGWAEVSFVGRPAPLDELDRHLDRIAHWGYNVIRLVITWEAIEHAGPGEYDEAYLEYLAEVVRRAGDRGLYVFIDAHQDVWSRWTGGDGAPYWCFESAGLRADRFVAAGAVALDSEDWPWGYARVPVATMFTLLFAGDTFCPRLKGVQDTLQSAYVATLATVAERLAGIDHVLGYDLINEPSFGYLGRRDLTSSGALFSRPGGPLRYSPLEYLAAADGHPVERRGQVLNPDGVSIWEHGCPWREAGVWDRDDDGRPVLVDADHFATVDGREVAVFADHLAPFLGRVRDGVRAVHPDAMVFVESSPWDQHLAWDDDDPLVVDARHWYDLGLLYRRRFDPEGYDALFASEPLRGVQAVADHYAQQVQGYVDHNRRHMGGMPLLLGEFGLPYDLNDAEAYRTGDYSVHEMINEAHHRMLDQLLLHSTQWTYTPDHDHAHGDGWNHEDLSIFSPDDIGDDADDLDAGGRGTAGFCRPHVLHAAGRPVGQHFEPVGGEFVLEIDADPAVAAGVPTEVYVPRLHYPDGVAVEVSAGSASWDRATQRLQWRHPGVAGLIRLVVTPP